VDSKRGKLGGEKREEKREGRKVGIGEAEGRENKTNRGEVEGEEGESGERNGEEE